MNAVTDFTERLKKEAATKRALHAPKPTKKERRMQQDRQRMATTNMAQQLLQLGQMYKEGLLTKIEFEKAKAEMF